MPYNGSGVFTLVSGNPVVTGTVISSTVQNNTMADIVNNGLTNCLTKDGQQTPTANIPLGGFRLTGVGNAVNLQDAITAAQFQTGSVTSLSGVTGTDTITALAAPAPAAYAAGQVFDFIAAGTNTTGVVTLNIGSLGAVAITKYGALGIQPGDIVSGQSVRVRHDGTRFQMISPASAVPTIVGSVRNLSIAATAAATTATLTADEIVVCNSLGAPAFILANFSKTINLATTGAGGMDTGTATANGFLGIYAIYNPTTGTAALLGTMESAAKLPSIYGGANMPSGYTASALVAVVPISGTIGQFASFSVVDRVCSLTETTVISSSTSSTTGGNTPLTASGLPYTARKVSGSISLSNTATANSIWQFFADANSTGKIQYSVNTTGAGGNLFGYANVPLASPRVIRATAFTNPGTNTMSYILFSSSYEI